MLITLLVVTGVLGGLFGLAGLLDYYMPVSQLGREARRLSREELRRRQVTDAVNAMLTGRGN